MAVHPHNLLLLGLDTKCSYHSHHSEKKLSVIRLFPVYIQLLFRNLMTSMTKVLHIKLAYHAHYMCHLHPITSKNPSNVITCHVWLIINISHKITTQYRNQHMSDSSNSVHFYDSYLMIFQDKLSCQNNHVKGYVYTCTCL